MKKIIDKVILVLSVTVALVACKSDDMNFKDSKTTPVNNLYEPVQNKTIYLENSSNVVQYFEWEFAKSEDGVSPSYEVVFDKPDGDFSKPIFRVVSENNGGATYVNINHRTLNKIASQAGYGVNTQGDVKWAVVTSRGVNESLSRDVRTLSLTRYNGFVDIPLNLFVVGEGTEVGEDVEKALKFKRISDGVFEIYTKLSADKTFHFIDATSGNYNSYIVDNGSLVTSTSAGSTVDTEAIYKLELDFNAATVTKKEVESVNMVYNFGVKETPGTYQGLGVWTLTTTIKVEYPDWAKDGETRYKLSVKYTDGSNEKLGHKEKDKNAKPNLQTEQSYFDLYTQVAGDDWDFSFRYSRDELHIPASKPSTGMWESPTKPTISIILNSDNGNYTHKWKY